MTPEWHGYPQHPDAHPERPWWRMVGRFEYERIDGARLYLHARGDKAAEWWANIHGEHSPISDYDCYKWPPALREIDREHPLPAPEPRCGQVWASKRSASARMVVAVTGSIAHFVGLGGEYLNSSWPPPGAVLVAGPGAPWAPMGGEE